MGQFTCFCLGAPSRSRTDLLQASEFMLLKYQGPAALVYLGRLMEAVTAPLYRLCCLPTALPSCSSAQADLSHCRLYCPSLGHSQAPSTVCPATLRCPYYLVLLHSRPTRLPATLADLLQQQALAVLPQRHIRRTCAGTTSGHRQTARR
jgi:hypothetical protein